jgi:hypothetical protein
MTEPLIGVFMSSGMLTALSEHGFHPEGMSESSRGVERSEDPRKTRFCIPKGWQTSQSLSRLNMLSDSFFWRLWHPFGMR